MNKQKIGIIVDDFLNNLGSKMAFLGVKRFSF
jgi:hypothetical protein